MGRLLLPILRFVFQNILSGALWSIGAMLVDRIRKKGIPMIHSPRLLFHPKVTFGAYIACLTTILSFSPDIKAAFGWKGLIFVIICSALLTLATYGRSPASDVDNNKPQ